MNILQAYDGASNIYNITLFNFFQLWQEFAIEMVVQFKVFKKTSPNGKLTLYMGRRDFVDHVTSVDPVGKISVGYDGNISNQQQIYLFIKAHEIVSKIIQISFL